MIIPLIEDTCAKLELAKRLRDARSEIKSIEVTLAELEKTAEMVRRLHVAIQVCRERLGEGSVGSIIVQATQIAQEIEGSRKRFSTENRRENLSLNNTGRKIQRLTADLNERWQVYAQDQFAPYLELLALVGNLPEVAASRLAIDQLVPLIRQQIKEAPINASQLTLFDQRLESLGHHFDSVVNLPNEVRTFLVKVASGNATINDLNPVVQAWIDAGGRASTFAISFTVRRS